MGSIDRRHGAASQEARHCLDRITSTASSIRDQQAHLQRLIGEARDRHCCSLTEIGEAAGIRKQSVHERLQRRKR